MTGQSERELRDKLVNLEPLHAARQTQFQHEVEAMFDPKMSVRERWYWIASVTGSVLFVVMAIWQVLFVPMAMVPKLIWLVFGILNVGMIVFVARSLGRGSMNVRHQFALGKISVGVTLLIVLSVIANAVAHPSSENLAWALFAVTWLILATSILVHNRIIASDLNHKEQSLRLEYRLAELAERLPEK
jgi:hypothetical protein